jgi:transposase
MLVWDRSGFVIYAKRLERGRFELPRAQARGQALAWSDLILILEGVSLRSVRWRKRYSMPGKNAF